MGAPLTFHGRLPGVLCESALPVSPENPLRLDVAAFVGFAERGPLDLPIAIEDISQYRAIFGGDLLLARTKQGGLPVFAYLCMAVQAFFDNGGRRCYVVRVAGPQARANRFRLPGLVVWDQAAQTFRSVLAPAAWVGRWSDSMSVGTQLRSDSLSLGLPQPFSLTETLNLALEVPTRKTLVPHDLLRLRFAGAGKPVLFCSVDSVTPAGSALATTRGIPVVVQALLSEVFAFTRNPRPPLLAAVLLEKQEGQSWQTVSATLAPLEELPDLEDGYLLRLTVPIGTSVLAGDLLRLTYADGELLSFLVSSLDRGAATATSKNLVLKSRAPRWQLLPDSVERLTATGWEALAAAPVPALDAQLGRAPLYTLRLPASEQVQVGDLLRVALADGRALLFPVAAVELKQAAGSPPAAEWWVISQDVLWETSPLNSPSDAPMYGQLVQVDLLRFDVFIREGSQVQEIWRTLRFGTGAGYWIERLVPPPPANTVQAAAFQAERSQQALPGLNPNLSARLGVPLPLESLLVPGELDTSQLHYLPLGMGALPGPDEFARPLPDLGVIDPLCSLASKDDLVDFDPVTLFLDQRLARVGTRDLLNEANALLYLNEGPPVEPLRGLHSLLPIDELGLLAVPDLIHRRWECEGPIPDVLACPPEPASPDWSCFQQCLPAPDPPRPALTPCGDPLPLNSPPAAGDLPDIQQQLNALPVQEGAGQYQQNELDALLAVQQALLTLCAARADLLGILTLPGHFKQREILDWQQLFTTSIPGLLDGPTLSYAAVYHPWLQVREEVTPQLTPLRALPPDGAACGMIAARELARGPWIAPANVPLAGVVGLTPALTDADWSELFNAQINLVRQKPGQFTLLSAFTLSLDTQLVQICVRRLLIFLRRLALRRGMRYVFEVNNERFRQRVQASFERTLTQMARRGALLAFEVVTGSEINTPNDYDNGRFLVALKVAPALPIEFITVVLLRAGEGLLEIKEL